MDSRTILVAEQNDDDFFLLERALKGSRRKLALQRVQNGQQAMEYLDGVNAFADRQSHPMPELLLLEFNLSGKHGLELVQWARSNERFRDLLIVFLTSSSHPDHVRQAYNAGANSFLAKPPGYDDYLALVRSFEEYWLGWNECPLRADWQGQK